MYKGEWNHTNGFCCSTFLKISDIMDAIGLRWREHEERRFD